jgi:hypothetical protein
LYYLQVPPESLESCRSAHTRVRGQILELMRVIAETCPVSDERTAALIHLDAVAFHVVASLRHE